MSVQASSKTLHWFLRNVHRFQEIYIETRRCGRNLISDKNNFQGDRRLKIISMQQVTLSWVIFKQNGLDLQLQISCILYENMFLSTKFSSLENYVVRWFYWKVFDYAFLPFALDCIFLWERICGVRRNYDRIYRVCILQIKFNLNWKPKRRWKQRAQNVCKRISGMVVTSAKLSMSSH